MSESFDDVKRRSSKRVAQAAASAAASSVSVKKFKLIDPPNSPLNPSEDPNGKIRKSTKIDFAKLEMQSLLKYKRHFKLPVRPNAPKLEVINAVRKHFIHHPKIKDVDVVSSFLFANQKYCKEIAQMQTKQG